MLLRILSVIVLFISMVTMPFYVSLVLLLCMTFYFSFFIEGVLIFLISDFLYGAPVAKLHEMVFVSFVISLVIFISMEMIKTKLRFERK